MAKLARNSEMRKNNVLSHNFSIQTIERRKLLSVVIKFEYFGEGIVAQDVGSLIVLQNIQINH